MVKKISCKQVQAIMPFYLKGSVNPILTEIIEEHLEECDKCKEYYLNAIEEISNIKQINISDSKTYSQNNGEYKTKEYANFKQKLSAYIDSELEDSENIKIKKMTISNPLARKDLENMYQFKRLLHSSFERTKDNFKIDFSKEIMKKVLETKTPNSDFLFKIGTIIIVITAFFSIKLFVNV